MAASEPSSKFRLTVLLVLCSNALPVGGIAALGWRPVQALFVYWLEIGVTILAYFVVVLFGQRDTDPEADTDRWYPGPVPIPVPDGAIRLAGWLPPLRYQNIQYVPGPLPLVALAWFFLSRAFLDFPNTAVVVARPAVGSVAEYIALSYTPEGLALAAVLSTVQLSVIGRDFLVRGLVEQYAASELVEIPVRIAGVWVVVLFSLLPVYAVTLLAEAAQAVVGPVFLLLLLGVKLAVDRALLQVRTRHDPGWLARRLVPSRRDTDQYPQPSTDYDEPTE